MYVNQHSQHLRKHKNRNSIEGNGRIKAVQGLNRSKDTEIELINKQI